MQATDHKVGATLVFTGLAAEDGVAIDLTGYTITCQARDTAGTLVGTGSVTLSDQVSATGQFVVTFAATTVDDWVAGTTVNLDVRLASGSGAVTQTQTLAVRVRPRQTTS